MSGLPSRGRRALRGVLAAAVATVALAGTAPSALANPLDSFGFGARGVALGGAVVASTADPSSTYYNPAGLALTQDLQLEIGYSLAVPQLTVDGGDLGVDASQGLQAGAVLPGRIWNRTFAFGLALHLPDSMLTRVRSLPQRQPRFVLYDNRPQRLVITAAVAFEIVPGLSIGAGLTFLSNSKGVLDVSGEVDFFDADRTALRSRIDQTLTSVRYASAGAAFRWEGLRLGVAFRDEFELLLDVDVLIQGAIVNDGEVVPGLENAQFLLVSSNHNLFSPRQLAFGVGWQFDRLLIEANVTWLQWSRFPSPTATVDVTLDIPSLDVPFPPPDPPLPPKFHDIFVPRLGLEALALDHDHAALLVRAGYFYEPSPAPSQPGLTNYIDLDKHGLSLGLGLSLEGLTEVLPKPIELELAGMAIWMPERTTLKRSAADPTGDYTAAGTIWGFTATTRWHF